MASGYLGKISAVVTVNTSDLAPKLNAGAKSITSFAKSTQATISSAMSGAGKSFDQIFTPLQKLQRALAVANKDPLNLNIDTSKVEKLVLAANQLAKPLGESTKQFAAIAGSVQRQFSPALDGVQAGMTNLRSQIEAGTSIGSAQFRSLAADVEVVNGAIGRLKEQAALSAKLFTGQELTFVRPESIDSLNRLAAAQQKLAAAPAATRSSPIARDLLEDSQILSKQIENISARIERLRAQGLDITVSQAGLDLAVRRVNEVASLIDQITEAPKEVKIDVNADNLIARAKAQQEYYAESERLQKQAAADAAAPLIARARAEQEYYAESDRLQKQAAADAAAPLIARARAEQEYYAESRRLQEQSAADAAAPLIARARAEQEFYAESRRLQEQAAADEAAPLIRRARGEMDFEAENARLLAVGREGGDLGLNLNDPARQIEQFRSSIVSVKGQLDSLPLPIRMHFLPAIEAAQREFDRLRVLGPAATAEEIENATNNMRTLTAAAQRAQTAFNFNGSFGGANAQGLDLSLQSRSLQGYQAQLQTLQQVLGSVSSEARGPAYASFIRLQQAISTAFENGTLDAVATRAEIARLTADAVQATAAVANVSARSLSRDLRRAGDVGRGGVDKFSLALNQAAFAIDDFLSSTGGLEFKLRAVSNNITQLGFVAGGTTGLFIGLAAVIGGQLAVAITRYVNDGRSAEDQTKALNDSLSKQKSLVEGLAAAYEKVADAVRDAGLSERGRRDAGVRRQVEDIQRQQKQAREERILGLDVGVAAARGSVVKAERELGASTTVGQRARAELELNAARQRQRVEERRALEQAGSPLGGIREAVISEITSQIDRETQAAFAGARAAAAASGGFGGQGAFAAARETERRNNERIAALQGIGGSPEEAIAALDERINQLLKSGASGDVILPLQQLRERILVYTRQLEGDRLASRISEGVLRIVDAMESANADISSAFDGVRGASAIESDLASFGETLAQFQRAAAEAAGRGDVGQVQAINEDINAIKAHIAALQDAAAAVRIFGSELQRLSESVAQDLSSLEQRAEDARRADVGAGTDASRQQRDQAESDARDARRARRQFEDQRASATERFEQDARANNDPRFRRVREIDAMLAVPVNEVGADGRTRGGTAQERDAARAERRAIQESIDNSVDNDPAVAEARRQRDAMTARAQEAQSIDRGRELSLTPGQRASEQLNQELQDIRNYFSRAVEESSGLPEDVAKIRGKMDEALARAEEDVKRQVAPAVYALQDARENALLQGPSRAALGASDVTTMQGQAELNRLLRGDDPAKDVNLLELQKQTKLLEDIAKNEVPVI